MFVAGVLFSANCNINKQYTFVSLVVEKRRWIKSKSRDGGMKSGTCLPPQFLGQ